jgi:hypothetical protein
LALGSCGARFTIHGQAVQFSHPLFAAGLLPVARSGAFFFGIVEYSGYCPLSLDDAPPPKQRYDWEKFAGQKNRTMRMGCEVVEDLTPCQDLRVPEVVV